MAAGEEGKQNQRVSSLQSLNKIIINFSFPFFNNFEENNQNNTLRWSA